MPLVSNMEEVRKKKIIEDYVSTVFKNKNDEVNFLNGLEENLL